jgi:competence protein ComEC
MHRLLGIVAVVLLLASAGCVGMAPDTQAATDGERETPESDQTRDGPTPVDGELTIHHLDVGQADATLLVTPNGETVLIDTGDWRQDGTEVIAALESLGVERIDHLVATHGHADHIGGHAAVIEHFETEGEGVGAAYDSGVPHDSVTYERYLDAIDEHDVDLLLVEEGDTLPLDDDAVEATVLNPPAGDAGSDLHANSVALLVEFGEFSYLTTGDAEREVEQRLVGDWSDELDVDVYQAGHHGSSTSSSPAFLDALSPDIAVISSDYDSQYGHPHDEVLDRFAARDIETYWTGVHGDVVLSTNGTAIEVETAEAFSTDPADLRDEKPDENDARVAPRTDTLAAPIPG